MHQQLLMDCVRITQPLSVRYVVYHVCVHIHLANAPVDKESVMNITDTTNQRCISLNMLAAMQEAPQLPDSCRDNNSNVYIPREYYLKTSRLQTYSSLACIRACVLSHLSGYVRTDARLQNYARTLRP